MNIPRPRVARAIATAVAKLSLGNSVTFLGRKMSVKYKLSFAGLDKSGNALESVCVLHWH